MCMNFLFIMLFIFDLYMNKVDFWIYGFVIYFGWLNFIMNFFIYLILNYQIKFLFLGVFLVLFKKNFNVDFFKVIVEIEIKVIVVFCCVSLYEIII